MIVELLGFVDGTFFRLDTEQAQSELVWRVGLFEQSFSRQRLFFQYDHILEVQLEYVQSEKQTVLRLNSCSAGPVR